LNFAEREGNVALLFLWENDKTIVIGKNQNPYSECDVELCQNEGVKIARRITGGGAVYHSKGNLNFSFILPKKYSKDDSFQILLNALAQIRIKAELSGRNDVLYDGKKFSGNAYRIKKQAFLHHGTILFDIKKEEVAKYLTPNKIKFADKSVKSVKSRITNLKEIAPDLKNSDLEKSLISCFLTHFKSEDADVVYSFAYDESELQKLYEKYSSSEWIYSKFKNSPNPSIKLPWGILEYDKNSKTLFSDCLEVELLDEVNLILKNNVYPYQKILALEENVNFDKNLVGKIAEFLKNIV
ncbi:lipoate--protein ligase family protein, partial [bacterium]|nr:lipoate--protein ligase family protein [bacterium]